MDIIYPAFDEAEKPRWLATRHEESIGKLMRRVVCGVERNFRVLPTNSPLMMQRGEVTRQTVENVLKEIQPASAALVARQIGCSRGKVEYALRQLRRANVVVSDGSGGGAIQWRMVGHRPKARTTAVQIILDLLEDGKSKSTAEIKEAAPSVSASTIDRTLRKLRKAGALERKEMLVNRYGKNVLFAYWQRSDRNG